MTTATAPLLVLAAMPEESAPLHARLVGAEELPTPLAAPVAARRGLLAGRETVVVTTGIGVAAAAAAATWGILAHRPRADLVMEGGTTFHFLAAAPAEALETAREAADGQDVRIGGGPTVVRDFLAAGLVDLMHLVQVPIVLGRGVRIWDGLEALERAYDVEAVSSPSGVTHLTFTRTVGS